MLLASGVNTPIDYNRSHLLALRVRILCELGFGMFCVALAGNLTSWNYSQRIKAI